jgi:hypothetical protein
MGEVLQRLLRERIPVTIRGRRRKIPKFEAIIMQLLNKAMSGDPQSIKAVIGLGQIADKWQTETKENPRVVIILDEVDKNL